MRALDRKLLRDLGRMKLQALAIALVVAAGMALFIGMATTSRALRLSQLRYYEDHRFAHVWSHLARAPESVIDRLAAIPGVAAADGRLVAQGVLDLPNVGEPATGLFIAVPPRHGHAVNDLYVRRGRHVEDNGADEALVSEAFAERNGLKPGDSVRAVIAGRQVGLHIVGVALSPEFLMQIPPGGLVPDDRRFGVFWLARERLADLLDLRGAVNDVAIRLASPDAEISVTAAVDRVLEPYGGQGAYGRSSQPSHVMLEDHITPISAIAALVPSVFLAVAAFLVNVVLSRLVATERSQIGMLKAFGYSNARLTRHYLFLVLVIVAGGILLSLPAGVWLGRVSATWFATFFRFPVLVFRVEPAIVVVGGGVMLLSSALGAMGTLRRVARLPPIVAMAPPAPTYRPTQLDRVGLSARVRTPVARMILRSVVRHPVRALLTGAGMSGAIAIVVLGEAIGNSLDRVADVRYQFQERQDLSVLLTHPRSLQGWAGVAQLPGIHAAEPYRAAPARLHVSGRVYDVTLLGLAAGSRLRRIVDVHYQEMSVPPDGAVMSAWLARHFGVRRGESVALEVREMRRRTVPIRIVGMVDEPLGAYLYMDLRALDRLLEEPATFAGMNVLVDRVRERDLYSALKRAPLALGVEFRKASIANFRAMGDQSTRFIRGIEMVFAVVIACGVVYNTARIAVAERAYDLATLRVLGFTRREVSGMLLGEIAVLAAPAIPLGSALGFGLGVLLARGASSALFRFPVVSLPRTYAVAIFVFLVAALGSALLVRRRLDRLDLVAVLKARE